MYRSPCTPYLPDQVSDQPSIWWFWINCKLNSLSVTEKVSVWKREIIHMLVERIFLGRKEMESRLKIRIGRNFGREKSGNWAGSPRSCCLLGHHFAIPPDAAPRQKWIVTYCTNISADNCLLAPSLPTAQSNGEIGQGKKSARTKHLHVSLACPRPMVRTHGTVCADVSSRRYSHGEASQYPIAYTRTVMYNNWCRTMTSKGGK